jgi:hypothetical protein
MKKYIEIISWLRTMACLDGSVFEDICNLNLSEGYPLVEIEVFTPEQVSSKFLICRRDLYLIAFYANGQWMQYANCGYKIDNCQTLDDFYGNYLGQPWKHIGPMHMIKAIDSLASEDLKISDYVASCEVFYVHLSEAARFYPIESMICKSLLPHNNGLYAIRPFQDEEMPALHNKHNRDVYSVVKGNGPIDFNATVETEAFIGELLKNFAKLSKVWFVYALTGKRHFPLEKKDSEEFHMKSKKSLRCTLATLCNINLKKVLREWKAKSENNHDTVTPDVYKEMERRVHELQNLKKVLTN